MLILTRRSGVSLQTGAYMEHNELIRKFEHLREKQADQTHEAAVELEALVTLLPSEKSRQLAHL